VVTGRLKQRTYETKEGDKRTVLEVEADDVAASLKFASAKVTKASRSRADSCAARSSSTSTEADPWASDGSGGYSEAPFYRGRV
jgi:single-strand DNA-binding protein